MTSRCYGTYRHLPPDTGHRHGRWAFDLRPDVAIRMKRIFPRMRQDQTGTLLITDTADTAGDLEWFMSRWPLAAVDPASEAWLGKQAQCFRDTDDLVSKALAGYLAPHGPGYHEPALPPYEYQMVVPELTLATGRLLCADVLGTGKTFSALLTLCHTQALPAVVVTLHGLPTQWQRQAARFTPWLNTHVVTSGKPYLFTEYDGQQELPFGEDITKPSLTGIPDLIIISYSKLGGWCDYLAGHARTIIFDEMQDLRTGEGTHKYNAAAMIAERALYKLGLTSTPVYNYGDEIFNLVQILAPGALGDWSEFRREWCHTTNNGKIKVTDPAALGAYLRELGILLRRTHADTGRPPGGGEPIRIEQPVDTDPAVLNRLSGDVTAMAKLVLDTTADRRDRWRAAGDLDLRLRLATGMAKAPFVAEFVKFLLESEQKVLLFGWHHDVYDVWASRLAPFNPVRYTGTETPKAKDANLERFINGDSRVMMMSLRAGAGVDGMQAVCNTLVFGEPDWSPGVHEQNIGRLYRAGQTNPVIAYFMLADDGSDPPMAEVLGIKLQQSEPILDPDAQLFRLAHNDADLSKVKLMARQVLVRKGIEIPTEVVSRAVSG